MATNCESCDRVLTTFERKIGVTRCPSCIELEPAKGVVESAPAVSTSVAHATDLAEEDTRLDAPVYENEEDDDKTPNEVRKGRVRLALVVPAVIALVLGATVMGALAWENGTLEPRLTSDSPAAQTVRDVDSEVAQGSPGSSRSSFGTNNSSSEEDNWALAHVVAPGGSTTCRESLGTIRCSGDSTFTCRETLGTLRCSGDATYTCRQSLSTLRCTGDLNFSCRELVGRTRCSGDVDFVCRDTLGSVRCEGDEIDFSCIERLVTLACEGESLSPVIAPLVPADDRDRLDGCNPASYATYDDYRCGGTGDAEHTEGCNPAPYATYDDYRCGGN